MSKIISPIYSGEYARAVDRDAAGALSRKRKGGTPKKKKRAKKRRISIEWFRARRRAAWGR